jgi:hypothetical protein
MRKAGIAAEVVVNFVLPWICYRIALQSLGETGALILSVAPPMIWSLLVIVWFKRLDAVSLIVVAGIFLSLFAMTFGGSPRLLLLRESLVTGLVGLALLVSMLFPKPLMYYLAESTTAKHSPEEAAQFSLLWKRPGFVRTMYVTSWVWGTALISEAALRCILAWTMPVDQFLLVSPLISYSVYFALIGWTFWFVRRMKAAAKRRTVNV